ncbi:MAG: radical SAM family heme chaperone HemW [Candidatus Binatia bacterium]
MSFSLYIHIPYCLVKCPYCDFNAYAATSWPEEQYVAALEAEFRASLAQPVWQERKIETLYFGGGTPSLFAPSSIARIITVVSDQCGLVPNTEISLEGDPASVSYPQLVGYREAGVNRLSLGVQSFQPALLKTLGRIHSPMDAENTILWARAAGFTNLSIDVIFAVPGQTQANLAADLSRVFAYMPEHLSTYCLTYEEKTPFFALREKGKLQSVEEDEEIAMYTLVQERSAAAGYLHYEISSFARPGYTSRHNASYWNGRSYLGLGAGAHSFANEPGWGKRWSNERNPRRYIERALASGNPRSFEETLTQSQAMGEFVFLQLRQLVGLSLATFVERFGQEFFAVFPHAQELIAEGLLSEDAGNVRLSQQGLLLADSVFSSFF